MEQKIRSLKNQGHLVLAVMANLLYNFPSRNMVIIGVTGTDGKTTTSSLIYHILKESGKKVALISTIGAIIDGKEYETGFHVTTPSYFQIQKYLKKAKNIGCEYAVIETTSHALDQNRVFGIRFDIGILTNVSNEHLNYHKNYKKYVLAKLKLLKNAKLAIVNSNGPWFDYVLEKIDKRKIITFSLNGTIDKDITIQKLPFEFKTDLIGDFNKENILAASICCMHLNIPDEDIKKAIENFIPPKGRQQIIKTSKIGTVMVDFAHTPGSFERILPEIRKITKGKLIHVFGSAGQRDRDKRSDMGKISSKYSDIIVLTAEDPRDEQILNINKQIKTGIDTGFDFLNVGEKAVKGTVYEIDDRKEAIEYALSIADRNDTVLITGKGHEKTINYGHGEIPWSDEEVVKEYLKK